MDALLLIDGNSIVNRAFYGVKALTTKDGRYTNAIVGFLNILAKLREQSGAGQIAVAFDVHAPTFRHQLYAEYKAGRKGMPEELRQQLDPLKAILTAMGIRLIEQPGYEADDILGTLSARSAQAGEQCYIATGDRDSLQLVDSRVTVLLATTKMGHPETVVYTPETVGEKYGLTPAQLIDLKALQGDTSDNIPGVPGVGEKTALDLMHRFGSVDALYSELDASDLRESLKKKLTDGKDSAMQSRIPGTICRTVPLDILPADCAVRPMDAGKLAALLQDLELYKWMEKLGLESVATAEPTTVDTVPASLLLIEGNEAAADILAIARRTGRADVLATVEGDEIIGLAVAVEGRCARLDRMGTDMDAFTALLTDETVKKRTHDSKPLLAVLLRQGKKPAGFVLDTALAAYLLDPLSSD